MEKDEDNKEPSTSSSLSIVSNTAEEEGSVAKIDVSLLECGICLNLFAEPITIPCGHTFCRTCIVSAQQKSKKRCPLCRAVCVIDATSQNENCHLGSILKTCFPIQYSQRLKEVEEIKKDWKKTVPIFFYNNTLLPGDTLKLHLFEPRYKLMIRRVVEGSRQFAYIPNYADYKPTAGAVGLIAQLVNVQFLHDGRALLDAKMLKRLKVTDHWQEEDTSGLYYCQYDELDDDPSLDDADKVAEALTESRQHINNLKNFIDTLEPIPQFTIKQALGPFPDPGASAEVVGWWLLSCITTLSDLISEHMKHQLLHSTSLLARMQIVNALMSRLSLALGGNAAASNAPPAEGSAPTTGNAMQGDNNAS